MIILAIYTHQDALQIALENYGAITHLENISINENTLSYYLPKILERILSEQQKIDCIVFHNGPGGFTSLRITSAFLQGVAFAKNAKIFTPSHFSILKEAYNISNGKITIDNKGERLPSVNIKNNIIEEVFFLEKTSEYIQSSIKNIDIYNDDVPRTMLKMAKNNKQDWKKPSDLIINYGMLPNYKMNHTTGKNSV